jgi:hypothetical protein
LTHLIAQVETITSFEKHGLPGIIIGTLFVTLGFFLRQHYVERKEILDSQKEERVDWRNTIREIAEKQDTTIKDTAEKLASLQIQSNEKFVALHTETLDRLLQEGKKGDGS